VTDTLAVAINRDGLHTLAVPETFEADGPFAVEFHNHGEASHVHVNLDDRLSAVARIAATNHYVEGGERRRLEVDLRDPAEWPSETVRGTLKVVVAHGQETRYVDVALEKDGLEGQVAVDPDLATPAVESDPDTPPLFRLLPVVVLGSVAVLLGVGALVISEGVNIFLGGLALLAAALCAAAASVLLN